MQLGNFSLHGASALSRQPVVSVGTYLHDLLPCTPLDIIQQALVEDLGEERLNGWHVLADHHPEVSTHAGRKRQLTAPADGLPSHP